MITGSYFAVGPRSGPAGDPATRTVHPSFDCATAKNADEEEICADPDLAQRDSEIARTYRDNLRRLDSKLGSYLRDDQRAWIKANSDNFETFLHPYWDKQDYLLHQTGNVRRGVGGAHARAPGHARQSGREAARACRALGRP